MFRKWFAPVLVFGLAVGWPALEARQTPPERIDTEMNAKIRAEGMNNSQIMRTMHYLTDVYGPRLTGSPNYENAARWAVAQMGKWGMTNGHLEAFEFKTATVTPSGGWLNEIAAGRITAPVRDNLVFEVLSWTPSTNGTVRANAVKLVTPVGPEMPPVPPSGRGPVPTGPVPPRYFGPTDAQLKAYFATMAPAVKGKIVFVGEHAWVPFQEVAPTKRQTEAQARARYGGAPADPNAAGRGGRGGGAPAAHTAARHADQRAGRDRGQRVPRRQQRGVARE